MSFLDFFLYYVASNVIMNTTVYLGIYAYKKYQRKKILDKIKSGAFKIVTVDDIDDDKWN